MRNLLGANKMRTGLTRSNRIFLRAMELVGGIIARALGLFLFGRIFIEALSLGEAIKPGTDLIVFLKLALPGIVIAAGCYLQAVRRNQWGLILMLVGGVSNVAFVVLNAGLAYVFIQDLWGQWAISANLLVMVFTLATAFVNAFSIDDSS